jgi:hypothetical protein
VATFVVLVLMLAPFVAPFVVVGAAVALVRRVKRRAPGAGWHVPYVGAWGVVAVLAGAAALGAYAWGVMAGFSILDPDQMCAARGVAGDRIVTRMALPVSSQCVTEGGLGTELVPGWVNPVVYVGLALFLVALGTGAGRIADRVAARKFRTQ